MPRRSSRRSSRWARALGLSVVAEGIESEEQFERVKALGCDEVQGYLFGRPLAALEFERVHLQPARSRVA